MDDFVVKPVDPANLFEKVASWLQSSKPARPAAAPPAGATPAPSVFEAADLNRLLGHVEDLDLAQGLRSLRNDGARYLELLKEFYRTHATVADELENLLNEGRHDDVLRKAHAMRGAAATLGLTATAKAAGAIEGLLRNRDSGLDTAVFTMYSGRIRLAQESLQAALADIDLPLSPAVSTAAVDEDEQRATLERLMSLLARDDINSNDVFRESEPALRQVFGEDTALIRELIESYDYPAALSAIKRIVNGNRA